MRFFTALVISCAALVSATENEPVVAYTTLVTMVKEEAASTPPMPAVTPAPASEAVLATEAAMAELRKRQGSFQHSGGVTHNKEEHEKFCINIGNVRGCVDDQGHLEGDFEKATAALTNFKGPKGKLRIATVAPA